MFNRRYAFDPAHNILSDKAADCNDTALARLDVLPVRLAARRLVSFLF